MNDPSPGLNAHVAATAGSLSLDVRLNVAPGNLVAVVGPNGAGKTTLLRVLAGLHSLDAGSITLDGRLLDGPGSPRVPPHRRGVGWVPQDDYLLPHLSALDNVAFGLRRGRVRAARWLERMGLEAQAHLRPAQLSGGQAKRVALARALAPRPRMLLLDEPLAWLDPASHREIRRHLREYLRGHEGVQIMVTHEPLDALALAGRVIVMEQGRIVQDDTPEAVRVRPRSAYVAEFVGVNLFAGTLSQGRVDVDGATIVVAEAGGAPADVFAVIHPRAVSLHRDVPGGSPRNIWKGVVTEVDPEGARVRVRVEAGITLVAEITAGSARELSISEGARVYACVKATEVGVFRR